ncbi:MAG: DUF22 domain-containing protein [archaeon]
MTTIDNFWQDFKKKQHTLGLKQTKGCIEHLIADEEHEIVKGRTQSIKVKRIRIRPNFIVLPSLYRNHRLGNVMGVSEAEPKPMDMERNIEYVRFAAVKEGKIAVGDFLGYVMLLPVERECIE